MSDTVLCHACGKENPNDADPLFCLFCGVLIRASGVVHVRKEGAYFFADQPAKPHDSAP